MTSSSQASTTSTTPPPPPPMAQLEEEQKKRLASLKETCAKYNIGETQQVSNLLPIFQAENPMCPGEPRAAEPGGGGDDQLVDQAGRPQEAAVAELDLLEGAQDFHLPDLQGRLHSPLQKVSPDCPEQKL